MWERELELELELVHGTMRSSIDAVETRRQVVQREQWPGLLRYV